MKAKVIPDPASLSQPEGVHEASEVINLNDFDWTDDNWKNIPLKEMIQYELHTGTFTLKELLQELDRKLIILKNWGSIPLKFCLWLSSADTGIGVTMVFILLQFRILTVGPKN